MTKKEMKKDLDTYGVEYKASASHAELEALLFMLHPEAGPEVSSEEPKLEDTPANQDNNEEEVTPPAPEPVVSKSQERRIASQEDCSDCKPYPVVDNVQVTKILSDRHTATHFHCRFADGTTRHVDRKLFS